MTAYVVSRFVLLFCLMAPLYMLHAEVSIIIPVLNEEERLPELITSLQMLEPKPEVIFIDGGSVDSTQRLIEASGARLLIVPGATRGRAMNRGAEVAAGELYLFLHADTQLTQEGYASMIEAVEKRGIVGGAFSLAFENRGSDVRLRLVEEGVRLRNRLLHLVYGDQAFFVQSAYFKPYRSMPLMEDVEWFARLKKSGPWEVLREQVTTSPRRLYKKGIFRSAVTNTTLVMLYKLGVSPEKLAEIYYQRKRWKQNAIQSSSSAREQVDLS